MRLKKVSPDQKGLSKLPKHVRNKMGYMNKGGKYKGDKGKTVKFSDHGITDFSPSLTERAIAKGGSHKNASKMSEADKRKLNTSYKMARGGRVGDPKKGDPKKESTSAAISFDMSATSKKEQRKIDRAEVKKERKAEKGMIPAKYRNRGQAGLDRYQADMAKKRSRKNAKGLAKIFGTKAARKKAAAARKAARSAKRRMAAGRGAGCQGKGCGAYE